MKKYSTLLLWMSISGISLIAQAGHGQDNPWLARQYACLHLAVERDNLGQVAQALLVEGPDPLNRFNETPLYHAVRGGNQEVVNMLLNAGANPNHVNIQGESPLLKAIKSRNEDIVRMLLRAGAQITEQQYGRLLPEGQALIDSNRHLIESRKEAIEQFLDDQARPHKGYRQIGFPADLLGVVEKF